LVEQRTENPCVGGSIPSVTTLLETKAPDKFGAFWFMGLYYVYILQSQVNDSFYKGSTNDLLRRVGEHNSGKDEATSRYAPWNIVWITIKSTRAEAFQLERKLKNLSVSRTNILSIKAPS
jgi:putative endonuclease